MSERPNPVLVAYSKIAVGLNASSAPKDLETILRDLWQAGYHAGEVDTRAETDGVVRELANLYEIGDEMRHEILPELIIKARRLTA